MVVLCFGHCLCFPFPVSSSTNPLCWLSSSFRWYFLPSLDLRASLPHPFPLQFYCKCCVFWLMVDMFSLVQVLPNDLPYQDGYRNGHPPTWLHSSTSVVVMVPIWPTTSAVVELPQYSHRKVRRQQLFATENVIVWLARWGFTCISEWKYVCYALRIPFAGLSLNVLSLRVGGRKGSTS